MPDTRLTRNRDVGRVGRWRGSVHAHRRSEVMPSPERHAVRLADDICAISSDVGHHPARHPSPSACRRQSHCRDRVDLIQVTEALSRTMPAERHTPRWSLSVPFTRQVQPLTSARMAEPFGMWSSLSGPTMTLELMLSAGVGRVAVFYDCEMWSRDR